MKAKSVKGNISKTRLAQRIFKNKKAFHKNQANLPIEEKIAILVKLQKIALDTQPLRKVKLKKKVWEI